MRAGPARGPAAGRRGTPGGKSTVEMSHVHSLRLARSHLEPRAGRRQLARVVADVCGVQAQFIPSAELALLARIDGLRKGDMARALWEDRTLVRTWTMRGTIHLHTKEELPVYLKAFERSRTRVDMSWLGRRGIPPRDVDRVVEAVVDALARGPLTRAELGSEVALRVGEWARPLVEDSWGGAARLACFRGLVCFGPERGRLATFVRTDRWLGPLRDLAPEEAQDELVARYLRGYGPATVKDLWRWAALPMSEARPAWERARPGLVEVTVGGRRAWALRADAPALGRPPPRRWGATRLLGSFDGYLLAHDDRSHLFDEEQGKAISRGAGWISPVVLSRGRTIGTWRQRPGKGLTIDVTPFRAPGKEVRAQVAREAARLGAFLGLEARVAWGGRGGRD